MLSLFSLSLLLHSAIVKEQSTLIFFQPHTSLSSPLLLYTNDNALHGFGAVLSLDELETLNKSLGFISACADKPFKLATTIAQNSSPLKPPLVYGLPQIIAKTL